MEIHPPHPVTSIKEFMRELAVITLGILIALTLEGLLEWRHHRELVRDARANILSELRENQTELFKEMEDLEKIEQQSAALVTVVHQLQLNRRTPIPDLQFGFSLTELHSTSWSTASAVGALSFMNYGEVKNYADAYDLQRDFETMQQRAFSASLEVQGLTTLLGRKPEAISSPELADAERRIGIELASVRAMQQVSKPLYKQYESVLTTTQHH